MILWLFAMLVFLPPTDPRLNEKSLPICPCDIKSEEVQGILDGMFEVAFGESQDRKKAVLVGLAAPQVGIQADLHWVENEEIPLYRIQWANWTKQCPRHVWESLRK